MTISSDDRVAGPFAGNGATVIFPFTFKVFTQVDLRVIQTDSSGVETDKTLTTHYTVSLNADQNVSPGGSITMLVAPPAGHKITITTALQSLQQTDLTNGGGWYPQVIEDSLDKLTILVQQVEEKTDRAITVPISSGAGSSALPNPLASSLIGWNAAADGLQNYPPSDPSAFSAAFGSSAGAGLVGFLQSGTGATARTVQVKLSETVSVKDFGAVGDGTTDDTAAIQAALTAHDAVYFPPTASGYRISSTLAISRANSEIFGAGRFSSFINLASQNFNIFNITAVGNVVIRNLGAFNYGAATSGYFVYNPTAYTVTVADCYTSAVHSGVLMGAASTAGGAKCTVSDCQFDDIALLTGIGLYLGGTGEIRSISNVNILRLGSTVSADNCFAGIQITGGVAINIESCQITGAGTPIYIAPPAGSIVSHVTLDRVWCDSSSGSGMSLDGTAAANLITGVRANQCWFSSNGGSGVLVAGSVRDLKLVGLNEMHSNLASGIAIAANATIPGCQIHDNSIGGNASTGIVIGANVGNFSIQGNQIGAASTFGANALG
ncbi:MAG: right-handed parallel beta-helix repeat-containing protein, partial [Rhizobiales bacterium]|nr:right-handed parallel beta-helix repeat-containing protein [Hyphomicrobiales bacterium]